MPEDVIKILPAAIEKPWAGKHLVEFGDNIGELVLVSDLDEFEVGLESNVYKSFQDYWQSEGNLRANNMGFHFKGNKFPILLKLLSVNEPLSIQVHPSDQDMRNQNLEGSGKKEAWYILDREEETKFYFGLKEAKFDLESFKDENCLQLLNETKLAINDVVVINPGLIHGLSGSVYLFEIQQPSNITYRIYDFNRNRDLHLLEAKNCFKPIAVEVSRSNVLLETEFSFEVHDGLKIEFKTKKILELLSCIGPEIEVDVDGEAYCMKNGETLLIWGQKKVAVFSQAGEDTKVIRSYVPQDVF